MGCFLLPLFMLIQDEKPINRYKIRILYKVKRLVKMLRNLYWHCKEKEVLISHLQPLYYTCYHRTAEDKPYPGNVEALIFS